MIDWIHARCDAWGREFRVIHMGRDGWPSRTTLSRMIVEGVLGASSGRFVQFFPECFRPEALETNTAIKRLNEQDREITFVHYVVIGKGKVKAALLGLPKSVYYNRIDLAHKHLSRVMSNSSGHNSQISTFPATYENPMIRAG